MSVSETVSAGQLRAFIERIERLEEEKRTIADDIKEVKAEAKGCGFDVGAINAIVKLRRMDSAERQEKEAILDIYKAALGMLPLEEYAAREASQSYAEAKGVEPKLIATVATGMQTEIGRKALVKALDIMIEAEETGEITDTQEQPETASETPSADIRVEGRGVHSVHPLHEQPETANQSEQPETTGPYEYAGTSSDENPATIQSADMAVGLAGPALAGSHPAANTKPAPIPHSAVTPPAADKTGAAPLPSSAAPVDPRCLNACHLAHSKEACHDCLIAWSARPKDEQVRLWAEANAARAA